MNNEYGRKVGERLRYIRRQKRMSLMDVELASEGEFKGSILGEYERGTRSISVPRLQRLARFYSVPVDQLLPGKGPLSAITGSTINITRIDSDAAKRYLSMIQAQRQDFNDVLTVRHDDLRAISAISSV